MLFSSVSVLAENCYHLNPDKIQPWMGLCESIFILKSLYILRYGMFISYLLRLLSPMPTALNSQSSLDYLWALYDYLPLPHSSPKHFEVLWTANKEKKKHKNREQRKGSVALYFACFPCSHGKINSPDVERVKLGSHQKEDFLSEGTRNGWRVRDALWVKAINRPENMYKSKWKDIKPSGVTSLFPRARRILESTDQTVGIESLPAVCAELWPENLKKTEKRCFSSNVLVIWLRFPPKSCLPASRQCNSPTLQKSWSKSHSAGMTC